MRQTIASEIKNVPSSSSTDKNMGQSSEKPIVTSISADEIHRRSTSPVKTMNVSQWTSAEVQRWIKYQCKKFELKKTNVEKFEMNGQALVLLSKNDFLRRSTDGEVLYYALQRLINATKTNKTLQDQSSSSDKRPRIVELNNDHDSTKGLPGNTSEPIVEEPDDPPVIRRSKSVDDENEQMAAAQRAYFAHHGRVQRPFFPMHGMAHPHGMYPNGFAYGQAPHPHVHPNFMQNRYPMAFAAGVLIELVEDTPGFPSANNSNPKPEQFYMVTMNGQRVVMNEAQVIQLVNELYRRQNTENQPAFVIYQ